MQVFSEAEVQQVNSYNISNMTLDRRDSNDTTNTVDNTYATIQPRNMSSIMEIGDYATLINNQIPSVR